MGVLLSSFVRRLKKMVGIDDSERAEFLASLGASESGLEQIIREGVFTAWAY